MKRVKQLLFKSWELAKDFYLRMKSRIGSLKLLSVRVTMGKYRMIVTY